MTIAPYTRQHNPFEPETLTSEVSMYLWRYATQHARMLKTIATKAQRDMDMGTLDAAQRDYAFRQHLEYVSHAFHVMAPFRYTIRERTRLELLAADRRVSDRGAAFWGLGTTSAPVCGCGRPNWQHIVTDIARYCPRDGRPYWQLAWAILRDEGCKDQDIRDALAPIARKG